MKEHKSIFHFLGQWWEQRSQSNESSESLSRWLPTPGNIIFTLLVAFALVLTQQAWANNGLNSVTAPGPSATTVNYQGRLADSNGNPVSGNRTIQFAIYDAASGGNIVWDVETHANVPVTDGLFNVGLGSLTSGGIPTTVWNGDRYLQITVNGEALSPRELIRSVPIAGMALTVPDGSITSSNLSLNSGTACLPTHRNINTSGNYEIVNVPNFALNFTLPQPSKVLIWFDGLAQFSAPTSQASVILTVNGDRQSSSYGDQNDVWFQVKGQRILSLDSGNHTIALAINSQAAGTMTIHGINDFQTCINYLVLGQ